MKKIFLFASLLAMVAVLATSCKDKVQAPSARFGYAVNDLTVTFTNLSKDAETYAWDFGDGATSTEKDPVHTYADFGDYTVKLVAKNSAGEAKYEEEINLVQRAIAIDGNFADWAAFSDTQIAHCVVTENAKHEHLYDAKFARDAEYIYFYLEFNAAQDVFIQKIYDDTWTTVIGTEEVEGYYCQQFDFYLNCGDETTGGNSNWLWVDAAADVCIEGSWMDQFEGATVHTWPEDSYLADDWLWVDNGIPGTTTCCEVQTLANSHYAVEGKIMIGMLPGVSLPLETLKIGVFASDAAWAEEGILPETSIDDAGVETVGELIAVPLL